MSYQPSGKPPQHSGQGFHVRSIVMDILLTLVTCGLYNIYVQYVQIAAVNDMLGARKYSFASWAILSLITCGLYHIYHEYRKTMDIVERLGLPAGTPEPILSVVLTCFGLHVVADAIQQAMINRYYGQPGL